MTPFTATALVVAALGMLWLALRILGDALAWWAMVTREEGDE